MKGEQRTVTLQDVAERAGVARATASLALSGKGRMSDATRRRVQQAAVELDYVANSVARNLRAARSGAVGLYVPDRTLSFRYYMDVAFGAVERAHESGLLVTLLPNDLETHARFTPQLDGFIVIDPQDDDPVVEHVLRGPRPVISGEAAPAHLPPPAGVVYGDHRAGMRLLLEHLRAQGAKRPLCILPADDVAWAREMSAGCEEWGAAHGRRVEVISVSFFHHLDDFRQHLAERLRADPTIDAVIGAPEGAALVAGDVLRAAGREVGVDVLLASYVDGDALALVEPPITALELHPREMGRRCMDLLVDALAAPGAPPGTVELPIDLLPRGSTHAL